MNHGQNGQQCFSYNIPVQLSSCPLKILNKHIEIKITSRRTKRKRKLFNIYIIAKNT